MLTDPNWIMKVVKNFKGLIPNNENPYLICWSAAYSITDSLLLCNEYNPNGAIPPHPFLPDRFTPSESNAWDTKTLEIIMRHSLQVLINQPSHAS